MHHGEKPGVAGNRSPIFSRDWDLVINPGDGGRSIWFYFQDWVGSSLPCVKIWDLSHLTVSP